MEYDVGAIPSEIDEPKSLTFYGNSTQENKSSPKLNNMGVENTWNGGFSKFQSTVEYVDEEETFAEYGPLEIRSSDFRDVGAINSEIDDPKSLAFYGNSTQENKSSTTKLNNMGVENTRNDGFKILCTTVRDDSPVNNRDEDSSFNEVCRTEIENYTETFEYGPVDIRPSDFDFLNNDNGGNEEENEEEPVWRREAGVCGLRNLGNTCFMSAGVQCLMATAPIVSYLLNTQIPPQQTLTIGLGELTKMIWSSKHLSVAPMRFKNSLIRHFPQFNDYRQHDCQEFLALLLDGLHEQLNTAKKGEYNKMQIEEDDSSDESKQKLMNFDGDSVQSTSKLDSSLMSFKGSTLDLKEVYNNANVLGKCNKSNSTGVNCVTVPEMNNNQGFSKIPLDKCDSINCDNKQLNNISGSGTAMTMTADTTCTLNNTIQRFSGLEDIRDIMKDQRGDDTKNVNVLITEDEANNELRFDSEKYPRPDNPIRRADGFNSNSFHLYENNTGGKRCKSTVTHFSSAAGLKEGLDLKRVKLNSDTEEVEEKNKKMEKERNRFTEQLRLDKNQRMECERKESECEDHSERVVSVSGNNIDSSSIRNLEPSSESEAEKHWQAHLSNNQSIIVETFQGQFKSTVICSSCQFVSVTFEPFMYLSVPLPNAMKKLTNITFVSDSLKEPSVYILEMNRYDTIGTLKARLIPKLDGETSGSLIIAEVLDHHISKLLDDSYLIRHVNDSDRHLYAFKVILLNESGEEPCGDLEGEENILDCRCIICLEDTPVNLMKQHKGCTCILCENCITMSQQHFGRDLKCPVCQQKILPEEDLHPLKSDKMTSARMINVPLVYRIDREGDGNNNQKSVELFGHPKLLRLPNICSLEALRKTVAQLIPCQDPYKLLFVDGKGDHCSRCMFTTHCRGCEINAEGQIKLQSGDSIAVAFSSPVTIDTEPMVKGKEINETPNTTLTLYDCIKSFSKSEMLDANNPWFCPHCSENRCATKTLSVWRYPDYLIVYLKRFVFHNHISTKLEEKVLFPLQGLKMASCSFVYDLYACVCHVGDVSAGHYTSYTQHPYNGQWHYFNDNFVSKQSPQEEDYSNAYILFYKKQGIRDPT